MKDSKACTGCREDYYNHDNNSTTGKCWNLDRAKIVMRYQIGWWTPCDKIENFNKVKVPSCYCRTGEFAYFDEIPEHLRGQNVKNRKRNNAISS